MKEKYEEFEEKLFWIQQELGAENRMQALWWMIQDEEEAEYRAQVDADVSTSVRNERNRKLTESDWTQLADSSANTTDWAAYRQALRDLPSTDGFPHNVTWPTEPS